MLRTTTRIHQLVTSKIVAERHQLRPGYTQNVRASALLIVIVAALFMSMSIVNTAIAGTTASWGENTAFGQLGNNSTTQSTVPVAVNTSGVLNGKTVIQTSAGYQNACAVTSDGGAYCWGNNSLGSLGDSTTNNSRVPVAVDTSGVLSGKTVVQLVAGSAYTNCAVTSEGRAYCWGNNGNGQLGNNTSGGFSSVPVAVDNSGALNGKTVTQISVGSYHACAITSDGGAYCWGSNTYGQLGNLGSGSVPLAVNTSGVLNGKIVTQISASLRSTCAVTSDGGAYCWGQNSNGQLGNNSTTQSTFPVAVDTSGVLNGKTVTQVGMGYYGGCVVTSDGSAYCWGSNTNGRLGNNSTINSLVPVAVNTSGVLSGKTVSQISTGNIHTCAVTSDGGAYCWGSNTNGQLGNNSTTQSTVPVAVNTSGVLNAGFVSQVSVPYGSYTTAVVRYGPTATTNAASSITTSGATLNGTVTANGAATTVTFEYGLTSGYGSSATAAESPLSLGANSAAVTATLTGLTCDTTYHFRVNATNSVNTTTGSDATFTTSTCPAPTVTSVSPLTGTTAGNTSITITGTGFLSGATVTVGGVACASPSVSSTSITCTTGAHAAGAVDIVVTNTDSQSGTGTNAFTYQSPDASGTTPGGTVNVTAIGGTFDIAQFITPVNPPSGQSFPYGVFEFRATTASGSVTITMTYPQALAVGTKVFKEINGTWVDFTSNVTFNQSRTTITYTITDEDPEYDSCNGQATLVCDPIGPSIAVASIPSLTKWTQLMLGLMVMMLIGWHFHRERSY